MVRKPIKERALLNGPMKIILCVFGQCVLGVAIVTGSVPNSPHHIPSHTSTEPKMKVNRSLAPAMIGLSVFSQCQSFIIPDSCLANNDACVVAQTHEARMPTLTSSTCPSPMDGASLLVSLNDQNAGRLNYQKDGFQKDTIVRILDGNTVKLQKGGLVSIAGARYPTASSNFQFSECSAYGPTYKLRQLIPVKTEVWVQIGGNKPQAVLFRQEDGLNVNQELVKSGFAKAKALSSEFEAYLDPNKLRSLEAEANRLGIGIFKQCDSSPTTNFVAEFEPLEYDVETQWGDDGGKQIVKQKQSLSLEPPKNPGDVKGCSDFENYEDALGWYEYYKPFYGDVAKLDRNGDGVPCPGLPHTTVREKYRMKKPQSQEAPVLATGETQ